MLALVGIYGVVWYIAAQRTHEVGIRRSHAPDLVMSALLYGVRPMDPGTYAGV